MKLPQSLLGELLGLVVVTLVIAVAQNAVRADGLALGTNHFPHQSATDPDGGPQHDYESWDLATTKEWHQYANEDGSIFFVDARSRKSFEKGHIPGAHLCDPYRLDEYLPSLLEQMKAADYVVIYCTGGDCEDSIQLATQLVFRHGLSRDLIAIFEGGWNEWQAAGLPIEEGS